MLPMRILLLSVEGFGFGEFSFELFDFLLFLQKGIKKKKFKSKSRISCDLTEWLILGTILSRGSLYYIGLGLDLFYA